MANYNFGRYQAGLHNVGSYQVSARPFVSTLLAVPATGALGTALEVTFPSVTKFVTVINDGDADESDAQVATLKFAFSEAGLIGEAAGATSGPYNFITLQASQSFSADFKITRLYLMATGAADNIKATVVAGLTGIERQHLSSSWDGLMGVSHGVTTTP